MDQIKILVVEDEDRIRHLLKLFFEKEGWITSEAENGFDAMSLLAKDDFNILVLDLMMPKMDGWQVCKKIKSEKDIPIIILTARGEESDRILGFELGAEDYVVKPFSPLEVVMRIKAILKRTTYKEATNKKLLNFPGLEIDTESHTAKVEGNDILLTPLEFNLISFFANNPGKALSREQLLNKIWGYEYTGETRTVDTTVKRLREKLSASSPEVAAYIKTIWGLGYKFEVNK